MPLLYSAFLGAPAGGGGGGGLPARYGRIEFISNEGDGTAYVLSEMQALESYDGGNLLHGATAKTTNVTSEEAGQVFANAFDARFGTAGVDHDAAHRTWAPTAWTGTHPSVDIDFGLGNDRAINIVRIGSSSGFTTLVPVGINVYSSANGTDFTLEWSASRPSAWSIFELQDIVRPGYSEGHAGAANKAYRRYRLLYFDVVSPLFGYACVECELRTTTGGADISGSGTPSALKDSGGSGGIAAAWDNNTGTFQYQAFGASSRKANQWIGYDLGAGNEAKVGQVSYRCRESGAEDQAPQRHAVQGSDDGTSWSTLWTGAFPTPAPDLVMTTTDPLYA